MCIIKHFVARRCSHCFFGRCFRPKALWFYACLRMGSHRHECQQVSQRMVPRCRGCTFEGVGEEGHASGSYFPAFGHVAVCQSVCKFHPLFLISLTYLFFMLWNISKFMHHTCRLPYVILWLHICFFSLVYQLLASYHCPQKHSLGSSQWFTMVFTFFVLIKKNAKV